MYKNEQFEEVKEELSKVSENVRNFVDIISKYFFKINIDYKKATENFSKTISSVLNEFPKFEIFIDDPFRDGLFINGRKTDEAGIEEALNKYINKFESLSFLDFLGTDNKNVIFVGPNGCGKTTLIRKLMKDTRGSNIRFIQADRYLSYYLHSSLPRNYNQFDKQYEDNLLGCINLSDEYSNGAIIEEFNYAVGKLENAHNEENDSPSLPKKSEQVVSIWKDLVKGRELYFNRGLKVRPIGGDEYPLSRLSSGEKSILFFLVTTILSDDFDYYFIDEPENNLNPNIVSKLWDRIEFLKPNSTFVYLTHNSEFVQSRIDSRIFWIKNFDGKTWEKEEIFLNPVFPKEMMVELYGNRDPIIFCESNDKNKYDIQLFNLLYKGYKVLPCGGCDNVKKYVKAYKTLNLPNECFGIIDKDYLKDDVIKGYKKKNIYCLPFHEIENIFCIQPILELMDKISLKKSSIDKTKKFIKEKFIANKENWIIRHCAFDLRDNISYHDKILSLTNETELLENYKQSIKTDYDINRLYDEYESKFNAILSKDSYDEFLKNIDLKSIMRLISKFFFNKNTDYEEKVFKELKKPENQMVLDEIRKEIDVNL